MAISTALRWIFLSIGKKFLFLLIFQTETKCMWTVTRRKKWSDFMSCRCKTSLSGSFLTKEKNTNTWKWKLSRRRKYFLCRKKKGITTLPRKTGHPSMHVRAYATPKRHKIRPLEIPSSFISFMFIFSILFLK